MSWASVAGTEYMSGFVPRTTKQRINWWENRQVDWKESYKTISHPHRLVLAEILRLFNWKSLIEVGCGAGVNIATFIKKLGGEKQFGGIDVNSEAIATAQANFQNGLFRVGSGEDIMMSDNSTDVVLTDMCLIYVGPRHIRKYLKEMRRIGRNRIVLCEFHSENWFKRIWLLLTWGYYSYNYYKLLNELGFYDIYSYKLAPRDWDGQEPQKSFGYVFMAKVPKYKI